MPPKKKLTAAAKVSKQESLTETLPDQEISSSEFKKIPKKPFFRCVDCDSLAKVEHVRVKLWKIHSCSISHLHQRSEEAHESYSFERNQREEHERKERFTNLFKSLTIKKSLKHVKRIEFNPSLFTKDKFIKQLCSTWRLDSLLFSVSEEFQNDDVLIPFLNSTLKNCHLSWDIQESRIDPKLIALFRIVRKCKVIISSEMNSLSLRIDPPSAEISKNFLKEVF